MFTRYTVTCNRMVFACLFLYVYAFTSTHCSPGVVEREVNEEPRKSSQASDLRWLERKKIPTVVIAINWGCGKLQIGGRKDKGWGERTT